MAVYTLLLRFEPAEVPGHEYLMDTRGLFLVDSDGNFLLVAV